MSRIDYQDTSRESIMKQWDGWRKYIAEGGGGSWPRDAFEAILDHFEEEKEKLLAELEAIKQWAKR